jgi:hypothetical protein
VNRNWFAAMFLIVKDVQQVPEADNRGASFSDPLRNALFRDIVISLWTRFPTQFAMISLWMTAVCKCPVCFLNDSELTRSPLFYTAMFLGVRRVITKSVQTWALSRRTKEGTWSKWRRRTSTRRMRTRYMCCRLGENGGRGNCAGDYYRNFRAKCATSPPHSRYY